MSISNVSGLAIDEISTDLNSVFSDNPNVSWNKISWKPDGSYAILVGQRSNSTGAIAKYSDNDGFEIIQPYINSKLYDVAWKPDGSYAVIMGGHSVYKFDGSAVIDLSSELPYLDTYASVKYIAWKPDGSYALLVGQASTFYDVGYGQYRPTVMKYDGATFEDISAQAGPLHDENIDAHDVAWSNDGSYAIIVGSKLIGYDQVLFYNETVIQERHIGTTFMSDLYSISFMPNYPNAGGIIAGRNTIAWHSYNYVGIGNWDISQLPSNIEIHDNQWHPNYNYTILVGNYGDIFIGNPHFGIPLTNISNTISNLNSICWNPNDSYGLIAGSGGTVLKIYDRPFTIAPVNDSTVWAGQQFITDILVDNPDNYTLNFYVDEFAPYLVFRNGQVIFNTNESHIGNITVTIFVTDGVYTKNVSFKLEITPRPDDLSDIDSDGLTDAWEEKYFGNISQGPNDDYDQDGFTNDEEELHTTDPTDSLDHPPDDSIPGNDSISEDNNDTPGFGLELIFLAFIIGILIYRNKR